MNEPKYKVMNTTSGGFCVFVNWDEAVFFYNGGLLRHEPYIFILLDPNLLNEPTIRNEAK